MPDAVLSPQERVREALAFTRWSIVDLEPSSLERVAAYLDALLSREPLKTGHGYANERIVIGCLITDLRTMVREAGEPVGAQRDLRDAQTRADERAALQRARMAFIAYDDQITAAIEEDRRAREAHAPQLIDDPAPAPVTPPAVTSDDELPAWA
jgi:hypothetical protein